jgi:hypothetical protein
MFGLLLLRSVLGGIAIAVFAMVGCGKKGTHKRAGDAAAVEIVTSPAVPDGGAHGGTISDEVEPNDGDEVATILALGATVHGKIDPDDDIDQYRIDVPQAGALAVMVESHEALDVVLEIKDASGNVIARSDRGGARIREGVPNLGITPGRYIAVVQAKKPPPPKKKPPKKAAPEPAKPIGGPYEITASMVSPVAGAEHEPDEDRGAANDLIAGDNGTGYIGWAGDADVWKVSVEALSAKNALDVELSAVEGIALSLEISDGVGQPITMRKGARGAPLVVRGFVPAVPQGAPPFHYLTVRADRSNPETAYQIRVVAKVIPPDAESEPNDTPETAMPVPADRKSLRAHWSTGDVDCFAVPPEDVARTLDVSIDTPNDLDLAIDLLVEGKLLAETERSPEHRAKPEARDQRSEGPAESEVGGGPMKKGLLAKVDHPGKGAAEKVSASVPAGAHAVIRVRGADMAGDGAYELVINEGAAPP